MKKNTMMMLALVAMTAGVAAHAENTQPAAVAAQEATAAKLSADEQAFAAKLSDQNRKAFSEKFSADQRKSAMTAVKNGSSADEAVQQLVASKDAKEALNVSQAEKATAEKAPAATTAVAK